MRGILLDPDDGLVRRRLSRSLRDLHAARQMPDVVGALGPSRSLRRFDGEWLGGICRWHLDPARFGNRGGEALGW